MRHEVYFALDAIPFGNRRLAGSSEVGSPDHNPARGHPPACGGEDKRFTIDAISTTLDSDLPISPGSNRLSQSLRHLNSDIASELA
jgi:hypothetical protein